MEQLNTIKELINQGNVERAILQLDEILQTDFPEKDEAYYLRGNAYRKQSNWQQAVTGVVLVFAVFMDVMNRQKKKKV